MKRIKFIAKNVLTGKWEGYTLQDLIEGKAKGVALENWRQFTGLLDKNGREIYEGNIIKYKTKYYGNLKEHRTVIEWKDDLEHDGFGEPLAMGYIFRGFDIEVIGNIYENSNLLKNN